MKHNIRHPLTEAEKTTISIDPQKGQGEPFVTLHVGQDPTLTEMYESILWAAQNLDPEDVEFEIDPRFAGELEYNQVFQYLNSSGFTVYAPRSKTVAVPVFKEEDVVITAPDGGILNVPPSDSTPPNVVSLGQGNRFTDYREGAEGGVNNWIPGELVKIGTLDRPMSLKAGIALGATGIVLTSLLTAVLLKKGN